MADLIALSEYRARKEGHPRDGIQIEASGQVMIVRHYRDGLLTGEQRIISERSLRGMLDGLPPETP